MHANRTKAGSIVALAAAIVLAGCAGGEAEIASLEDAKAAAAKGEGIVLVDFYTDW
jgi:hypothetical protein